MPDPAQHPVHGEEVLGAVLLLRLQQWEAGQACAPAPGCPGRTGDGAEQRSVNTVHWV